MLELLTDFNAWAALASLTALEIVLGVDNVVFISILVERLDPRRSETARRPAFSISATTPAAPASSRAKFTATS